MKKLIAIVLVLACMLVPLGCETNAQKEKALMENGPWANEAIWADDNAQIYLLCTKSSEDVFAKVIAYLFVEEQWRGYTLDLYQGAPIVSFTTSDGERILEAKAKMDGQKLRLYDFEAYAENVVPPHDDVTLTAFAYREKADQLPFEIEQ